MSSAALLIAATLFASLLMLALYLIQRRTGDAGIVDAGWCGGLGIVALGYAVLGAGDPAHRVLLLLVALPWSFRLAYHLISDRVLHGEEDGRYQALRERWGATTQRNFFLFFQVQAGFILLFSVPMLLVAQNTIGGPTGWDIAGLVLGLGAIAGESLADRQLRRWKAVPEHRGTTCRAGLWRYSRHPNYFFEWLHWWAYVLLCVGSDAVWFALLGPAVMLVFLYRITGIPYTEKQALRSRGADYRNYQETTSAFFPWFPKRGGS